MNWEHLFRPKIVLTLGVVRYIFFTFVGAYEALVQLEKPWADGWQIDRPTFPSPTDASYGIIFEHNGKDFFRP